VQGTLEDIIKKLLVTKPSDPIPHILQFLEEKLEIASTPLDDTEQMELNQLKDHH